MTLNVYITKAKHLLEKSFYVEIKHKNIISVSQSKQSLPFLYVLYDPKYSHTILMSFATDLHDPVLAATVALELSDIGYPLKITESFYIDTMNNMSWGEDAFDKYELDIHAEEYIKYDPPNDLKN